MGPLCRVLDETLRYSESDFVFGSVGALPNRWPKYEYISKVGLCESCSAYSTPQSARRSRGMLHVSVKGLTDWRDDLGWGIGTKFCF